MNYENYDNNLRTKFESFAPSGDESAMWAEIEAALPKKKNRKYFFFFTLAGVVVLAFALGYYILDKSVEQTAVSTMITKPTSNKSLGVKSRDGDREEQEVLEAIITNEKRSTDKELEKSHSERDDKLAAYASSLEKTIPSLSGYQTKTTSIVKAVANQTSLGSRLSLGVRESKADDKVAKTKDVLMPATALSIIAPHLYELERELSLNWNIVDVPEIAIAKDSPWSMDITLGGGLTQSVYTVNEPSGANLANLRENLENDLEALGATVSLQYRLSDHWTFGLGLTYLTQVVSSEVLSTSTAITSKVDTTAIFHTAQGVQIETGPREFLETTQRTHLRYQRSQQLLLPISLKYSGSISNAWGYQLGVGYGLGLWSTYQGLLQDPLDQDYDLGTDIDNRLESRGSDRLLFDTHIIREIAGFGQLKFGVNYLYDLNGRYNDNQSIQKQSHALQLSGGLIIPLKF